MWGFDRQVQFMQLGVCLLVLAAVVALLYRDLAPRIGAARSHQHYTKPVYHRR